MLEQASKVDDERGPHAPRRKINDGILRRVIVRIVIVVAKALFCARENAQGIMYESIDHRCDFIGLQMEQVEVEQCLHGAHRCDFRQRHGRAGMDVETALLEETSALCREDLVEFILEKGMTIEID